MAVHKGTKIVARCADAKEYFGTYVGTMLLNNKITHIIDAEGWRANDGVWLNNPVGANLRPILDNSFGEIVKLPEQTPDVPPGWAWA